MKLILIGFLVGIGKIIPGVSGALMAIRLGVYERAIDAITHFFKDIYHNGLYLGKLALCILIAILLFSNIILSLYQLFPCIMTIIFALLILTGVPSIIKKANYKWLALISFIFTMSLNFIPSISFSSNSILTLLFMGLIEAVSIIIPGVSGTAILINLGLYENYLMLFANLNISLLVPFFLSLAICSLIIIYFINYLINHYTNYFYSIILGFLSASILLMFI